MECAVFQRGNKGVSVPCVPYAEYLRVGIVGSPKLNNLRIIKNSAGNIHTEIRLGSAVGVVYLINIVIAVAKVIARVRGGGITVIAEELCGHVGGDIGPLRAAHISCVIVGQGT